MTKTELERKHLSDLHLLAAEAGVEKYRLLTKGELIDKLAEGNGGGTSAKQPGERQERPRRRRRSESPREPREPREARKPREPRQRPEKAPEREPRPEPARSERAQPVAEAAPDAEAP